MKYETQHPQPISTNNCASLQGRAIAPEYQILVSGIKYKINVGWVEERNPTNPRDIYKKDKQ
ncbi:hypothetical protein [Cylindrospermopsis raciborskii]|uniref:hypothetical protein n=1 Tax=Cylindrospermopsis raciborskii TaxID=77022 RepID=UPI000A909CC0|nr:hypothetical protein [Cylindrospermopsis raciborskii]